MFPSWIAAFMHDARVCQTRLGFCCTPSPINGIAYEQASRCASEISPPSMVTTLAGGWGGGWRALTAVHAAHASLTSPLHSQLRAQATHDRSNPSCAAAIEKALQQPDAASGAAHGSTSL